MAWAFSSPLIMREIAIDGGRLTREYLRHCTTFPAAANLCHFMRNATPPRRRAAFDQLYDHAVVRLLESAGQSAERYFGVRQPCRDLAAILPG